MGSVTGDSLNVDAGLDASGNLIDTLKTNHSKYENVKESKGLLVIFEQQLFVWHNSSSCILTAELDEKDVNSTKNYIALMPTNPPVFEVDYISINRMGSLLALVGHKGIMIIQIPWLSRIQKTKNTLFCRSWHVAERFFICTNRVQVLQASWHPGSLSCSHLVVLSSDNYFRLYDATDPQTPLQVFHLGSNDESLSSKYKVSYSACSGDSVVSFDFGPPESISITKSSKLPDAPSEELLYPIYVLHSNGDVYILSMPLHKSSSYQTKIEGPLVMYPSAEDNYGVDACSLICLSSNPPVLVIAMATGMIYHCILLENANDLMTEENKFPNSWSTNNLCRPDAEIALYVQGSIELPLSLSPEDIGDIECFPLKLYKDVASYSKYHCSLVCGVHTVVLPFIKLMEDYGGTGDAEGLVSQLESSTSIVEHLLCTRPLSSVKEVPVIGLSSAISDKGIKLICLLASWEFVSLPLLSSFLSEISPLLSFSETKSLASMDDSQNDKFSQEIQQLLYHSTSTPLLKAHISMDNKDMSDAHQYMELLWNSTNRFREEYIDRLSTAHVLIEHRMEVLIRHKKQQMQELVWHLKQKDELRHKAESLAVKYEESHANQQLLFERIEKVMKLLQQRYPILSTAEISMKRELISMEEKLKAFKMSLERLNKKFSCYNEKYHQPETTKGVDALSNKMENLSLSETHIKHIKEMLQLSGGTIGNLVKTVVGLQKETGI